MASAGKYPIVGGSTTLKNFFDAVEQYPRPEGRFSLSQWMKSSGLMSSYYRPVPAFAEFIGLVAESSATDLWSNLRDPGRRREALLAALQAAYADVLGHFGLGTVAAEDSSRISTYIRTRENVSAAEADQAAATIVQAFDHAEGRAPTQPVPAGKSESTYRAKPEGRSASRQNGQRGSESPAKRGALSATLAINLQIVLPPDADDERYSAMLEAVAKHLGPLLA